MNIHVYAARLQPATHFVDPIMPGKPHHYRYSDQILFRCDNCGRVRWANKMRVQVYYDMTRFFCADTEIHRGKRRCK